MLEWLKEILGDAYTQEIDKKVSEKIGTDFVARADFDSQSRDKKALEDQLEKLEGRDTTPQEGQDATALSAEIERLKGEAVTTSAAHQSEIAKLQKTAALRMAFSDRLHDPEDAIRLLDLSKVELSEDGTLKSTPEELLSPYKESKAHWFKAPPAVELRGVKPIGSEGGAGAAGGHMGTQDSALNQIFGIQ